MREKVVFPGFQRTMAHCSLSWGLALRFPLITEAGSRRECSQIEFAPLLYNVWTIWSEMKKKPFNGVAFTDNELVRLHNTLFTWTQHNASQWLDGQLLSWKTTWIRREHFPVRGLLPVAVWEATVCASGGGHVSCVCPDYDERCSTHRKSTHPCSPRPSGALRGRTKCSQSSNR